MATLTKEQYEALKRQGRGTYRGQTSSSGQFIIEADKFIGDLQGNADTATRLRDPITISLGGDAEGSAQFAGSSFRLDATIREAEHSVNADVAENSNHSAQASHADLANIATLALRSMLADNASHAEEASHADDSTHADSSDVSTLATRALHADDAYHADEADNATYALKDSNGDNIHNTFVDKQSQITTNTNNIATHENTLINHEGRIQQAESNISSLDTRVGNIETSTDVGRITQRIVNIEAKDVEQDGRLDAINDTMVTLSTAQYILSPKTFNAGSKTIMDNEAGATEITNKEYVDNKVLSSANYVTDNLESYTDNKVLSASRYMTDYVDNKVLSTAQYVDDNFMSLTKSQYVTGLNTYNTVLPQSNLTPTNDNDFITKKFFDENQSSGHALFDVVPKDHVLTYGNDLEGFAPLGTWVYKTAVDGTRYGYPDFVQKCLDEYEESTDVVINGKKFVQPILSANGTLGGDSFAVQTSSEYNSTYPAWRAFDGITSITSGTADVWASANNTTSATLTIYNPISLRVTRFTVKNRNYSTETGAIGSGTVYGSNDGETWTELTTFTNDLITANAEWNIELSTNTSFFKYYKLNVTRASNSSGAFVAINELYITANEPIPVKRHSNGHIFFDIADIDKVNAVFAERKEAWLYGIDETNERVFLPRSTRIKFGSTSEVGEYQEAGLPNIIGQTKLTTASATDPTGAVYKDTSSSGAGWASGGTNPSSYSIDASLSSSIYGNSNTVEYSSTKLIPYMVVGNVKVEQASTDVIDVTTTNNDTVPLFAPHYFDYKPNNLSWLKGGEQSNSGDLYKTCYNELVNVLNGETKYGSLKVIDETDMVSGEDYSLYWIVNQTTETFRTPTATQQRFVVKTWKNGTDWYRIYNDGWCEQGTIIGGGSTYNATLIHQFKDLNYQVYACYNTDATGTSGGVAVAVNKKTISSFEIKTGGGTYGWFACGYIDLTNETFDTSLYFKVANAVENIELLDVGEITEALTSKADTDLSNVSNVAQSFKNMSVGWGMPDYDREITISLPYTVPCDGYLHLSSNAGAFYINATINNTSFTCYQIGSGGGQSTAIYPLKKGTLLTLIHSSGTSVAKFYPCLGAN